MYIYAKTGFGNYAGFNSAFGYWASNVAGNVFFLVFTMTTLGTFFPGLGEGNTFLAVALASACVWFFHYLIARGVRQAAAVNRIVTIAKLVCHAQRWQTLIHPRWPRFWSLSWGPGERPSSASV